MLSSFISDSFMLAAWLALFPLTYLAHITEEYWGGGGYSKYLLTHHSIKLSPQQFLRLQALGLFLMSLGVVAGIFLRFPATMMAILSAIVLGNALVHTLRSFQGRMYTPGLITAVVLWLPLGLFSLLAAWPFTSTGRFALAIGVGVATNGIVEMITMKTGTRRQGDAGTRGP